MVNQFLALQECSKKRIASKLKLGIVVKLETAGDLLGSLCSEVHDRKNSIIRRYVRQILSLHSEIWESISSITSELVPLVPDNINFLERIEWLNRVLIEPKNINFYLVNDCQVLDPESVIAKVFFNIAFEALTNVSKHSQAKKVTVVLEETLGEFSLVVADDGVGFDPDVLQSLNSEPCLGLAIMHLWINCIGGHLFVDSCEGEGTRVVAKVKNSNVRFT